MLIAPRAVLAPDPSRIAACQFDPAKWLFFFLIFLIGVVRLPAKRVHFLFGLRGTRSAAALRNMSDSFPIIDLVSQGAAVQRHLKRVSNEEKLAWLAARGKLTVTPKLFRFPQTYYFESVVGLYCSFFFQGDIIVFIGDNTTFTVSE